MTQMAQILRRGFNHEPQSISAQSVESEDNFLLVLRASGTAACAHGANYPGVSRRARRHADTEKTGGWEQGWTRMNADKDRGFVAYVSPARAA